MVTRATSHTLPGRDGTDLSLAAREAPRRVDLRRRDTAERNLRCGIEHAEAKARGEEPPNRRINFTLADETLMNGVDEEPMMSPYSSFSITITAMCDARCVRRGDGWFWAASRLALAPQPHELTAAGELGVDRILGGADWNTDLHGPEQDQVDLSADRGGGNRQT